MPKYFLLKSEPETYSIDQLKADKKTNWNGVRNFQARNVLSSTSPGDLCLIYHSGKERAVVGIAEVTSLPFPDPDPKKKGDWVQMEVKFKAKLNTPVTLADIKVTSSLKSIPLLKQSRLSSMEITKKDYDTIINLSK